MSENNLWCPDVCPITDRPFFMWIEHWENGDPVPTYGGPCDSYTIPVKDENGDYICERYDHNQDAWIADTEDVGVQVVDGQLYTTETDPKEMADRIAELERDIKLRDGLLEESNADNARLREQNRSAFEQVITLERKLAGRRGCW